MIDVFILGGKSLFSYKFTLSVDNAALATDSNCLRIFKKKVDLLGDAVFVGDVVSVHTSNVRGGSFFDGKVGGVTNTSVFVIREDFYTRVFLRV